MKQKTVKKSVLKKGYYYEENPWYDHLSDTLPVPEYQEELFPKTISHQEILDTYHINPYTIAEAFAVAAHKSVILQNGEYLLVYFKDGDTTCRLSVYRNSDGKLGVYIGGVNPVIQWPAGDGVLFSNNESGPLETSDTETLEPLNTLTDEVAIAHLKKNGYRITKEITTVKEF